MQIIEIPIKDIAPYPKNSKLHPEKQIKQIAKSISEFGFLVPIILDKDKNIVAGHGRYLAALLLAKETVPCIMVEHLTEEQVKAYRLADNKLAETDFDMEMVIEELKSMSLQMIDLTGFNSNLILETIEDKPDLSKVGVPKSVEGDIYIY